MPKHHITQDSDNSQSPTFGPSSPNSPDDMNSSLLRPSDVDNNYIFGKFAGFTLKPLPTPGQAQNLAGNNVAFVNPISKVANSHPDLHTVPSRAAPPPPISHKSSGNKNHQHTKNEYSNVVIGPAPALPPLNPGSTARPIISNPILSGSTRNQVYQPCEASNKLDSNRSIPTAPLAPSSPEGRVISVGYAEPIDNVLINPVSKDVKKTKESKLSRITSFLKKEPKVEPPNKSIDREKLKTLEISPPIPISIPKVDEENERKAAIIRAQSMRDQQNLIRPATSLNSFGSMRSNRPKSIVNNVTSRPNFPPPRPPAPPSITSLKIQGIIGQNPLAPCIKLISKTVHEYDDCDAQEVSPQSPDNIYSVIDEGQSPPNLLSPPLTSSGSIESMGLLNEIVNEIECRNFDSIYIASTLGRNKLKNVNEKSMSNEMPDEQYSSTNVDSNGSTTSSGYMRPSAINAPIARIYPSKSFTKVPSSSSNSLSSFKSAVTSPSDKPDIKVKFIYLFKLNGLRNNRKNYLPKIMFFFV